MTSPTRDYWQIQDAKQRFSEMIRAVAHDGPQVITRHGEAVAVVVDIAEYRRLTRPTDAQAPTGHRRDKLDRRDPAREAARVSAGAGRD
jgi:prevent-host-death family protein